MEQTEKKPQTIEEKLEAVKNKIVANSKDAKWAKDLLDNLTSLQKQSDVEEVELIVPTKSVIKEYNVSEAVVIKKTTYGFLYHCKGGLEVFVPSFVRGVHEMLSEVCDFIENPSEDKEEEEMRQMYINAVMYVFQAPIFSCVVGVEGLLDIATLIVSKFNEHCKKEVEEAALKEETEQDIRDNMEAKEANEALEILANTEITESRN